MKKKWKVVKVRYRYLDKEGVPVSTFFFTSNRKNISYKRRIRKDANEKGIAPKNTEFVSATVLI